ncbi:hypothetical protein Hydth_0380 [Hydrogenobacter thermophilus TK-6]|uniref:Uncharacterized protein n=2 Tax=Hydrogenobacter thermophilus TaxID=940 RepID=D3DG96_HYDTT|nr:hypothetical protein Hydth_0380 [Hydrogenobacter thermophilus TK-6]BAI68848.1 hypothetical protein HTH_0382 [Hydrogenobacter thermophilus TK-6]
MRLKALLMSLCLFALAQEKSLVKTEIKFQKAECIKVDKGGACLIYSPSSSDNLRYNLLIKSVNPIKQGKYTLLVLASHVGFMDPLQISLIRSIEYKNLNDGLKLEGTIDKERLPLKDCADFRNRILLTPFIFNKELTQKEIEDMLNASRYCPDPKNKYACSYSAFFAYVQKTGMVLNAVNHEFVTLCKGK